MQAKEAQACNKPARNGRRVTAQAENVVQAIKEVVSNADAPNKTMICTSVAGATVAEALETIKTANQSGADLLELRLDFYEDFAAERHLKQLLDACAVPKIVTYRPSWEGYAVAPPIAAAAPRRCRAGAYALASAAIARGTVLCTTRIHAPRRSTPPPPSYTPSDTSR